ncbi:queen brain-selective protein-1 [Lasioglossum baleicum]|uniref:queen brain-selective protein-1 n=1 Tax=Lasioglossum baleicum TaxID=434251 RepID=UPI003FCCC8CC
MPAIQTIFLAALILVVLVFDKCFGHSSIKIRAEPLPLHCELCGEFCHQCEFGAVTMPYCGQVCAKGHGQLCGGPKDRFGICGEGMYCNCNRCHGCSEKGLACNEAESDVDCPITHKAHRSFLFA